MAHDRRIASRCRNRFWRGSGDHTEGRAMRSAGQSSSILSCRGNRRGTVSLLAVFAVAASLAACAGDDDAEEANGSAPTSPASEATTGESAATTEESAATTAGATEGTEGTAATTEGSDAVESGDWGGIINAGGEPQQGGTLRIDQGAPP